MPRTLVPAVCLALLLTSSAVYAQPQLPQIAERLEASGGPSLGYTTVEMELKVIERDSRPLKAYLQPSKGTSEEDVEKVYGKAAMVRTRGPERSVYPLGETELELEVFYREKKVAGSQFTLKGSIQNAVPVPTTMKNQVTSYRYMLSKYRAAIDEYDEKLADAAWNRR